MMYNRREQPSNRYFTDSSGKTLRKGDMIEFKRDVYSHWGIYVGEGYIIHATGEPNVQSGSGSFNIASGFSSGVSGLVECKVLKQLLTEVADGFKFYVNNYNDEICEPFPPYAIVKRAFKMVGEYFDYNLLKKNCEHFVTYVRYGKPISKQAEDGLAVAGEIVVGGLVVGGLIGLAGLLLGDSSKKNKNNNRR